MPLLATFAAGKWGAASVASSVPSLVPSLFFVGNIVSQSGTGSAYTSFTGNTTLSTGNKTIVLVIQSRDSNGSTSDPYTSVTVGGVVCTIISRAYSSGDYNSSCIAYLSNSTLSGNQSISVSLSTAHEGQANIAVYEISHDVSSVNVQSNDTIGTGSVPSYSTGLTTPSGTVFSFATANVSNSTNAPVISVSGGGTYTSDVSKDGGTTEYYSVYSGSSPSNTSLTFTATVSGLDANDFYAIQVASFGF